MIAWPFYVHAAMKYKILHKAHHTEPVLSLGDFVISFRFVISSNTVSLYTRLWSLGTIRDEEPEGCPRIVDCNQSQEL